LLYARRRFLGSSMSRTFFFIACLIALTLGAVLSFALPALS
jgi:hypothetical protein